MADTAQQERLAVMLAELLDATRRRTRSRTEAKPIGPEAERRLEPVAKGVMPPESILYSVYHPAKEAHSSELNRLAYVQRPGGLIQALRSLATGKETAIKPNDPTMRTINLNAPVVVRDVKPLDSFLTDLLAHETAHVITNQATLSKEEAGVFRKLFPQRPAYNPDASQVDTYSYGGPKGLRQAYLAGAALDRFSPEQIGMMVEDYMALREGRAKKELSGAGRQHLGILAHYIQELKRRAIEAQETRRYMRR